MYVDANGVSYAPRLMALIDSPVDGAHAGVGYTVSCHEETLALTCMSFLRQEQCLWSSTSALGEAGQNEALVSLVGIV